MRRFVITIKDAVGVYGRQGGALLAGGLAYYSLLSVVPFLILVFLLLGLFLDEQVVRKQVALLLVDNMGEAAAKAIGRMVASANEKPNPGGAIVSFAVLGYSATRLFRQTQLSLDRVFGVGPPGTLGAGRYIAGAIERRVRTLGMVLVVLVLMGSYVASDGLMLGARLWAANHFGRGAIVTWGIWATEILIGVGVLSIAVAAAFQLLSRARLPWQQTLLGAVVTATLFVIGRWGMVFYFTRFDVMSAFGVFGSIVLAILFFQYSAQVFLFGAAFTRAAVESSGARVQPDPFSARWQWGVEPVVVKPMAADDAPDADEADLEVGYGEPIEETNDEASDVDGRGSDPDGGDGVHGGGGDLGRPV